eukprot:1264551-Rhodomonas_salina.1
MKFVPSEVKRNWQSVKDAARVDALRLDAQTSTSGSLQLGGKPSALEQDGKEEGEGADGDARTEQAV